MTQRSPSFNYEEYINGTAEKVFKFIDKNTTYIPDKEEVICYIRQKILEHLSQNLFYHSESFLIYQVVDDFAKDHFLDQNSKPEFKEIIKIKIKEILVSSETDAKVINGQIIGTSNFLRISMHESLDNYSDSILKNDRIITISTLYVFDSFMVTQPPMIFEFDKSNLDFNFIKTFYGQYPLNDSNIHIHPFHVIVRITEIDDSFLYVVDDTIIEPCKIDLTNGDEAYAKMVNVGDVLLIINIELNSDETGHYFFFTDKTIVLRLPNLDNETEIRPDIKGIVYYVTNNSDRDEWVPGRLFIQTEESKLIEVNPEQSSPTVKYNLVNLRKNHFIWLFNLIKKGNNYYFCEDTVLYNLTRMIGIYFSGVEIVKDIIPYFVLSSTSLVVKALVTSLQVRSTLIHIDCGSVIFGHDDDVSYSDFGKCHHCKRNIGNRTMKTRLYIMDIDDGLGKMTVGALSSAFQHEDLSDNDIKNSRYTIDDIKAKLAEEESNELFKQSFIESFIDSSENTQTLEEKEMYQGGGIKQYIKDNIEKMKQKEKLKTLETKINELYDKYQSNYIDKVYDILSHEFVFFLSFTQASEFGLEGSSFWRVDSAIKASGNIRRDVNKLLNFLNI